MINRGMINRVSVTFPWRVRCAVVLFLLLAGCLFPRGHENFKKIMQFDVGKSADDPSAYRNHYRRRLIATKKLPTGNIEEKFDRGTCPVYFEIDPVARKIVG